MRVQRDVLPYALSVLVTVPHVSHQQRFPEQLILNLGASDVHYVSPSGRKSLMTDGLLRHVFDRGLRRHSHH